jgi:hypothetical protein
VTNLLQSVPRHRNGSLNSLNWLFITSTYLCTGNVCLKYASKVLPTISSLTHLVTQHKMYPFFNYYVDRNYNNICLHNRRSRFDSRSHVRKFAALQSVHADYGVHLASYSMGTSASSLGSKATCTRREGKNEFFVPPLPMHFHDVHSDNFT